MHHDTAWDVDSVRDEHESEEQWALRREFIDRWKAKYPRERLLCLARVFTNVQFIGCRYPQQVMQEIATLSLDVADTYKYLKCNNLQQTFVSVSDAAQDLLKSLKRKESNIEEVPNKRIHLVAQGHTFDKELSIEATNLEKSENQTKELVLLDESEHKTNEVVILNESENERKEFVILDESEIESRKVVILDDSETNTNEVKILDSSVLNSIQRTNEVIVPDYDKDQKEKLHSEYMKDLQSLRCLEVTRFHEHMFLTDFGKLVLIVRPWLSKLSNIRDSCSACGLLVKTRFENNLYTLYINRKVLATADASSRAEAQSIVEDIAWNRLWSKCVILLEKELFVAQDSARISSGDIKSSDIVKATDFEFGTPVESSIASKMMSLMGWSGGGLGPKREGISEPIRPHMQQVHKSGLGSVREELTLNRLTRSTRELFLKYRNSDTFDADLVFTNEFSIEERGVLHRIACQSGLKSKSYGDGADRFLVVRKKKVGALKLVHAVVQKGGVTPKYQVFIPHCLSEGQVKM